MCLGKALLSRLQGALKARNLGTVRL